MVRRRDKNPKLQLIRGGRQSALEIGSVQIFVGPENMAPYAPEAFVAEEDTYLVLSADPEFVEPEENPLRVLTEAYEMAPEEPGSIVVREGRPLRLLAIVHDLNQEPSCKEEWVESALDAILKGVESRKIQSLALPLLGTLYGSLEKKRFLVLLRQALERCSPHHLKRIWIFVPEGTAAETLAILRSECQKES